jgi:nuclear pore complex protein Nup98-Nup96
MGSWRYIGPSRVTLWPIEPSVSSVHHLYICFGFYPLPRKLSANSSIITKTTVPIFSDSNAEESSRLLKLLTHHLGHTSIARDADGIPFANPSPSLRFSSFVALYAPGNRSYEAAVYRLGHALFDDIDLKLSATGVTVDVRNRITSVRRKEALSAWLEEAVALSIDGSLKANASSNAPSTAYTLLTGNQVEKACEVAVDGGNVKLATLISQAAGDFEFREDLRLQLEVWREQRVDVHVDEGVRKVYALLAGVLDVIKGSKATGLEKCKDVDIFEGLDWKRAFGVHLWFTEPMDAPIAQVFESYDRQRLEVPERVAAPCPWYTEHPPSPSAVRNIWNLPSSSTTPDALFSLIQLHSDPGCSLSHIFNPLSFGLSPIDYALPWHLYIILSRCMGVRDFADRGDPGVDVSHNGEEDADHMVEGHSPSADLLASSYAMQLESLGLLQEAVFVLLHIEGSAGYVFLPPAASSILM